jgi:predicted nucleic acid-binding protein
MAFVIDASIAASWWMPDETHPGAHDVLRRFARENVLAPALWWYEIRSILIVSERRGRIDHSGLIAFLADMGQLEIELDHAPESSVVIDLARRHRISAYDAAYLELAMRNGASLATLDGALAKAARAQRIDVVPV